jgi:transcription-repair coupling factor (superfamily II helicase)
MLIPPGDVLSADAMERLSTMQEYTELGSGFRVAQRDLEIRGAGNLLGASQSGFINSVGFDLYCSLLKKAVDGMKGAQPEPDLEPEINLKTAALIPEAYIQDPRFRVGFYRRLSSAKDDEDLQGVRDELRDRFGVLPAEVDNLVEILRLRRKLQKLLIRDLSFDGKDLVLTFDPRTKVDPQRLLFLSGREPKKYRLAGENKFKMRVPDREKVLSQAQGLLELLG